MEKVKNGVVFVSEKRYMYMCEELERRGVKVYRINSEKDYKVLIESRAINVEQLDFVVIAVRGTKDGYIELGEERIYAKEFLEMLGERTRLIAGVTTEYEEGLDCRFVNFQKVAQVVKANSEYTAEGVLEMLLSLTPKSIFSYSYDIVGTGNTGTAIYKLLSRLGLQIRMISREGEQGTLDIEQWKRSDKSEVIVNTVPAPVMDKAIQDTFADEQVIIDIASGGVGATEEVKQLPHIKYYQAPPLPGKVAPQSAGILLAEFIYDL